MIERNLQWVAWSVLLAASLVFLGLVIGGPWWAYRSYQSATAPQRAWVESKSGALKLSAGEDNLILESGTPGQSVQEGWVVETLPNARAFVDLSDPERAASPGPILNLDGGTVLALNTMRRPRFAGSGARRQLVLGARAAPGRSTSLDAAASWDDAALRIETPVGNVDFGPESRARLEFAPLPLEPGAAEPRSLLRVIAVQGPITVTNAGRAVGLAADQRTEVLPEGVPAAPRSGPQNMVVNGSFREDPLSRGWVLDRYFFGDPPTQGQASHQLQRGGRSVVRFEREGAEGTSADVYLRQDLDLDLRHATRIQVIADLRVIAQSLPGGGMGGSEGASEYPLILRLRTENHAGQECEWPVGFYAVAPEPGSPFRSDNGVQVAAGEWTRFDSGNLMDPDNPGGFALRTPDCDPPARLVRIEIRASGHDYQSEIDSVGVWVE